MAGAIARGIADRITTDRGVMVGKPDIKGTRLPVELVLAKLAADPNLDELFLDYSELTIEDVEAAVRHAAATSTRPTPAPAWSRSRRRRGS